MPLTIANYNHRAEAETATTLDHFRHPVNLDNPFFQVV
jgi:hypothetical protein